MGREMQLIPMKPCESCWETYAPKSGNQKFCSNKCLKKETKKRERARRKQSLIDGSGGEFLKLRFTIFRRDNFICQYCGRGVEDSIKLHIDHIVPKSKGGTLAINNLITSCFECNEGKKDVVLTEREQKKLKSKNRISNGQKGQSMDGL